MRENDNLFKLHMLDNLKHCPDFMSQFHLEWQKMADDYRKNGKSEDFIDGVLTGIITMTHAIDKAFCDGEVRNQ